MAALPTIPAAPGLRRRAQRSVRTGRTGRTGILAVLATLSLALIAACGSGGGAADSSTADGASGESASGEGGTLTVFAAASLSSSFEQLGELFEEAHGTEIVFGFTGSSDLAAQIISGAPADVFASADEANMDRLAAEGLHGAEPQIFATNTLQIAVPPDNPAGIEKLQDLTAPGLNLVLCAPELPCGAATATAAQSAGIELQPVSEEQSVTDVLAKVASGEADAGLVYVTDVLRAGDSVLGIEFPESSAVINGYPITTVDGAQNAEAAQAFVDFILGPEGQRVLDDAGFGAP